jgi:hypothetical protein
MKYEVDMYMMGETENKRHLCIQNMQLRSSLKRAALIGFIVFSSVQV